MAAIEHTGEDVGKMHRFHDRVAHRRDVRRLWNKPYLSIFQQKETRTLMHEFTRSLYKH
jgi:hypothetical protein